MNSGHPPRILLVHNAVAAGAELAELDVLTQACVVETACLELGYPCEAFGCNFDLGKLVAKIESFQPTVVFNLVESLAGRDQLAWLVPALLETLQIPCTGSAAVPLNLSNDKLRTKQRLQLAGLPTPAWETLATLQDRRSARAFAPGEYILKAIGEHASLGLDDSSVVNAQSTVHLRELLEQQAKRLGKPCFAEQFIASREFNLSLLAAGRRVQVLPPAEIDFSDFPADKPRIVGYAAKWIEGTFEFERTPRRFEIPDSDQPLLNELATLARSCWQVLELDGWVRVDFRVDEAGRPYILEVNTNPCLSPYAGFAAAAKHAGMSLTQVVERIITAALAPRDVSDATGRRAATPGQEVQLRETVTAADEAHVREIVAATSMFRPNEVDVAAELVRIRLRDGAASGYEFVFAEQDGKVLGYACFGLNTVTVASYDLYWIAVRPDLQGRGIGQQLLAAVEERIAAAGGERIYIETSGRADYAPTRRFYERCGYALEALLRDYYAEGDDKAVFVRRLS